MKEDEIGGTCGTHGRDEKCIHFFGKSEGMRLLGRPRRRWENKTRRILRK